MTRRDILTAVPVAFAADGSVDYDGTREILQYVAASGNEGAFVLGTTGEFPALSLEERGKITELAVAELAGRMRVVIHVGAASTYESLQLVEQVRAAGAKEIAVLTPYYLASSDNALYEHFKTVAEASDGLDVYIYVFKAVTGNFVSAELMARLAKLPNVVGAKISGEPMSTIEAYRAVVPEEFILYTGADRELALAAASGAQGVVSGISSVLPKPFRALVAAADSGDEAEFARAQAVVDEVVDAIAGDMGRMKAAYKLLGINGGTTRMAIEAPDAAAIAEIEKVVERYR